MTEPTSLVDGLSAVHRAARKLSLEWNGGDDATDRDNALAVVRAIDLYDDRVQRTADALEKSALRDGGEVDGAE